MGRGLMKRNTAESGGADGGSYPAASLIGWMTESIQRHNAAGGARVSVQLPRCAAGCAAEADARAGAGCAAEIAVAGGDAPEWVQLLPAGPDVVGRDGRRWRMESAAAVVEGTRLPLPITYDHAGFHGREAPAAGWVEAIEARGGAIWGRVEWTAAGRAAIAGRTYRFISPEFLHGKSGEKTIEKLIGVALVNAPNLELAGALNGAGSTRARAYVEEEKNMDITERIRAALGVAADAGEDAVVAACEELRGRAEAAADLERYVPRADHDAVVARAAAAEQRLAAHEQAAVEGEIEGEIAAALEAGKIVPATVEYHRAACREEGGLERFRGFVAAAPEIGGSSQAGGAAPPKGAAALNDDQRRIFGALGVTAQDAEKYGRGA